MMGLASFTSPSSASGASSPRPSLFSLFLRAITIASALHLTLSVSHASYLNNTPFLPGLSSSDLTASATSSPTPPSPPPQPSSSPPSNTLPRSAPSTRAPTPSSCRRPWPSAGSSRGSTGPRATANGAALRQPRLWAPPPSS
ncbi:hypothetical protein BU16DRAFT_239092 [Lophium mytilinum]|uniref:Uncharacterized protein n=1 Tax=Lophium mytilinum TaxID=390894 RepID=A0A6A6R9P9_9PEZI|nr:hypothetical protein BU16DRAFT_239092 [Lophium mytilinum]